MPERTNGTDLKSVGGDKLPRGFKSHPLRHQYMKTPIMQKLPSPNFLKSKIFILLFISLFLSYVSNSSADYPDTLPFQDIIRIDSFRKDMIIPFLELRFSMWQKKINAQDISLNLDNYSILTSVKGVNYGWEQVVKLSGNKVSVQDFDVGFSTEYAFSDSFFARASVFSRYRTFGPISSFGLGDIFLSFSFRLMREPIEIFPGFSAVIPLAGEPDENLITFRRINVSSFGVDFPFQLLAKKRIQFGETELSPYALAGYILRIGYIIFGQNVFPGDIVFGGVGISSRIRNFFLTRGDLSHDLGISSSIFVLHGFPESQDASIYKVTGSSWDIVKLKINPSFILKKEFEELGKKQVRDFAFVELSLFFTMYERSFIYLGNQEYVLQRFPFLDRVKPGFSSILSAGLIF